MYYRNNTHGKGRSQKVKRFSEPKALAAILYLCNRTGKMDLYALLKTLYYADKDHFQEFGRTITGDIYHRLPFGPVPSRIYDMLKSVRGDGIWTRDLSDNFEFIDDTTIIPKSTTDMARLSETDIEKLDQSFLKRGKLTFNELCREAHEDSAFKLSPAGKMTEDDFAEGDPVLIEHLKETRLNEQYVQDWRYLPSQDEEAVC